MYMSNAIKLRVSDYYKRSVPGNTAEDTAISLVDKAV